MYAPTRDLSLRQFRGPGKRSWKDLECESLCFFRGKKRAESHFHKALRANLPRYGVIKSPPGIDNGGTLQGGER